MPSRRLIAWANTKDKLRTAARARGYHHGWVRHQIARQATGAAPSHAKGRR